MFENMNLVDYKHYTRKNVRVAEVVITMGSLVTRKQLIIGTGCLIGYGTIACTVLKSIGLL